MTASTRTDIPFPLPARPAAGEIFQTERTVRLGDVDTTGRLRLDSVARYAMDIGYDHLGFIDDGDLHPAWLVTRTVIDVLGPIGFGERLRVQRWPSALSNRWFTARIRIEGDGGALVEVEQFLINVDPVAGRPARMTERFMAPMLAVTTDHRLRWRPVLEPVADSAPATAFPLRATDFDHYGHVNNAVHWQVVEEELAARPTRRATPYRAVVEHLSAITAGQDVTVRAETSRDALRLRVDADRTVATLARVTPLPA
ncbi:acyl-[acyl-carrier-protein] thioesterase [Nocardia takedensis]